MTVFVVFICSLNIPSLPVGPVWVSLLSARGGSVFFFSSGSGVLRGADQPLGSASDWDVGVKQFTVHEQARKHGKHHAQHQCTNVAPHYRISRRALEGNSWHRNCRATLDANLDALTKHFRLAFRK